MTTELREDKDSGTAVLIEKIIKDEGYTNYACVAQNAQVERERATKHARSLMQILAEELARSSCAAPTGWKVDVATALEMACTDLPPEFRRIVDREFWNLLQGASVPESAPVTDPFNCPQCGAHDFGLNRPTCPHCGFTDANLSDENTAKVEATYQHLARSASAPSRQMRKCGACHEAVIPMGVDWPAWKNGAPICATCMARSASAQFNQEK